MQAQVLWRRLDTQGHDACRLSREGDDWVLEGAAVAAEQVALISVSYRVVCGPDWVTRSASVSGWSNESDISLEIVRNGDGSWHCNGVEAPLLGECVDIDLGFTPATNTCAIRRLQVGLGQRRKATAAWLDDSVWQLKPLQQYYLRKTENIYEYGSPAHGFTAQLTVDTHGFVREYPDIWSAEASESAA